MTLREFISSPVGCHSCESRNPVLIINRILKTVSKSGLRYVIYHQAKNAGGSKNTKADVFKSETFKSAI